MVLSEFEDLILLIPQCLGPGGPGQWYRTKHCSLLRPRGAEVEPCALLRDPAGEERTRVRENLRMDPVQGVGGCLPLLHEVDGVSMSPRKPLVLILCTVLTSGRTVRTQRPQNLLSHCLTPFQLPLALLTASEPYEEKDILRFQAILLLVCGSLKERGLCRAFEGPAGDSPTFPFPQLLGSSLL